MQNARRFRSGGGLDRRMEFIEEAKSMHAFCKFHALPQGSKEPDLQSFCVESAPTRRGAGIGSTLSVLDYVLLRESSIQRASEP
jgi:hypothetical protein